MNIDDKNWSWSQFTDIAKGLMKFGDSKHNYALFGPPDNFLNERVKEQYSTFVDQVSGKAFFESDAFTNLLKQVKSLYDEHIATDQPVQSIFRNVSIVSPADYIRELKMSEYNAKGYEYFSKLVSKPHADGLQAGGYFRTYKTIGINEKSAVKEEAWEFIKFMMSDEMQASSVHAGFSINKAVFEQLSKQILKEGKVMSDQEMGSLKGKAFAITEKDIQDLKQFITHAIYPVEFKPSKVEEIISDESKAYFSGQKTAEAVAKLIQNRVTIFLNE